MAQNSNNIIGVTGEYFVCAELGRQGILALITPKNNPLFDIVAVSPDASRAVTIQVKTMSEENKQGWKLGMDICKRRNNPLLYTVLVNINSHKIDYYIYEYDILSEIVENLYSVYLKTPKKNKGERKDVDFRWFNLNQFTDEDWAREGKWPLLKLWPRNLTFRRFPTNLLAPVRFYQIIYD